jgi:uncharacterized membrane protein YoaK (UPF0700 family)
MEKFYINLIQLAALLSGDILSALFVGMNPKYTPSYTYSIVLLLAGINFLIASQNSDNPLLVCPLSAMSCGMINCMGSYYSGGVCRTSHVTGTITDMALEMTNWSLGRIKSPWKLRINAALYSGFLCGSLLGAEIDLVWGPERSLLVTTGLLLFLALANAEHTRREEPDPPAWTDIVKSGVGLKSGKPSENMQVPSAADPASNFLTSVTTSFTQATRQAFGTELDAVDTRPVDTIWSLVLTPSDTATKFLTSVGQATQRTLTTSAPVVNDVLPGGWTDAQWDRAFNVLFAIFGTRASDESPPSQQKGATLALTEEGTVSLEDLGRGLGFLGVSLDEDQLDILGSDLGVNTVFERVSLGVFNSARDLARAKMKKVLVSPHPAPAALHPSVCRLRTSQLPVSNRHTTLVDPLAL